MKRYTKVILLGSAIGFAPLAAAAESVAVALSASFEPVYAYTELDIVATGTVPGQVVIVTGETDNALGWPVQHDHAVTGTGETSDTDVTVTGTASGMMYDGQALTSLSVAAGIGDSAAATAASTQGATSASAASTLDGNPIFLETDFDGRSNAYESAIVIMAADRRPD
ncbi:hypothetical protein [Cereibacter johrii]|uniref:Uncharacterized protein n=1 Tax=Cereibacter johrii TaxID=445629 RepID=A0ABX5J5N1_9RHOB|nr:hypothetical protein [Cereibacter johrii]MEA5163449.1 hypothetical protein [Cereibacter johrii]ODM43329.1 hypothetical protein A9O63_07940 [Cereibacter johrii]PTM75594.1 hypothetical protein C8J29_11174 [Cereibacter johrii]RDS94698.1 hypothetical protein DWF04_15585 [Cereibacter sphaeroides f. sp. denitrificans]